MSRYDKMTKQQLIERVLELESLASKPYSCTIDFSLNALDDADFEIKLQEMCDLLYVNYEFETFDTHWREL